MGNFKPESKNLLLNGIGRDIAISKIVPKFEFGIKTFLRKYLIANIVVVLFAGSLLFYSYVSKNYPVSYYDEELWVGDAYYLEHYLAGNFSKEIWDTPKARQDPMLAKFAYGMWMYPLYLIESQTDTNLKYSEYLINYGLYPMEVNSGEEANSLVLGDSGTVDDMLKKYGAVIEMNLKIIIFARHLNVILFSLMLVIMFYLLKKFGGMLFGLIFVIFYGLNSYLVGTFLVANADSFLVFFFNLAILYMINYFLFSKRIYYQLLFSIFLGLCFSVKINGIMLYFPYLLLLLNSIKIKNNRPIITRIIQIVLPLIVAVLIFIVLNPHTYPSPIVNIFKMFIQRYWLVLSLMQEYSDTVLPNLWSRLNFIWNTLSDFRIVGVTNQVLNSIITMSLQFLFFVGLWKEIKLHKSRPLSKYVLVTFLSILGITLAYLSLGWPRYVAHLVFFYTYYVTIGLTVFLNSTYSFQFTINKLKFTFKIERTR